jgi:transcriptional regulator with XRE-family HTH domain
MAKPQRPQSRALTRRSSRWLWAHDYNLFRKRLVEARRAAGLTQREVAQILGRAPSYVANSETGERRVDFVELTQYAAIYKQPLAYFAPFFKP